MDYAGDGSPDNEHYTSVNAMSKEKRICHRHTPQQIQKLEAYFKECPHPNESQREAFCSVLDLGIDQVKFWFQNKRTQSKAQDERTSNILLREENEKLQLENAAMIEVLKTVTCPPCGGPPFGRDDRESNLHKMRLENAFLKTERDSLTTTNNKYQQTMLDSLTYVQRQQTFEALTSYGMNPYNQPSSLESQTIQPQLLPQLDIPQLSETAATAVEELKRLFRTDEALWVMSSIDGTYVIDQESYEKFSHSIKHFRNLSARVESSKDITVVPIEATSLIDMFLDSEKWKMLFPTIVNKAKTIHTLGSELPINENLNVLQVIWEQLHILSPLVPPREFMIVRCCQQIGEGLWIIADVSQDSQHIFNSDQASPSCYKRPSGCLIRSLPNAHTEVSIASNDLNMSINPYKCIHYIFLFDVTEIFQVRWIEHVEVDHTAHTHKMYRELVSGSSGYGARRWIVTLERMCERMALSSILIMPATDWSETIPTVEGRRSVMKLGERMLKIFNEMLIMSGKVEFPQQSKCGVRISIRMNKEPGQLPGLVVTAASCLSIPLTPLQVFNFLRSNDTRHQWDVLCRGNAITESARIFTGSSGTNCITLLQPTPLWDIGQNMVQEPHKKMMVLQECYMDALGGMIVYSPLDMATMSIAASGEVDPLNIPILPSGFTISSDNSEGTLLMLAFQILNSDENSKTRSVSEIAVDRVSRLISQTVQNIKLMLNCPPE
ncbi:homeobox-leucine zipper protein HDG8 isoform X1 [Brassica napus]|uniref:homeobox-leucine zipper protein HDG8 isoform X1 n=1 Tax=Brassica napus TaxID=3708 RepID=UPI0020788C55|nr:homeobox-leucine zipper protein HDG8 isoform X1 [Brassica napus]